MVSVDGLLDAHEVVVRSRLQALAPRFYWEAVAAPLVEYCNQPYNTRRASRLRHKLVPFLSSGYDKFKR